MLRRPPAAIGLAIVVTAVAVAVLGPSLAPHDPFAITGGSLAAPSRVNLMGTDALGRDVFSAILFGARTSLVVASVVSLLAIVWGGAIGLLSGYRGGWLDDLCMRTADLFQVIPRFFLAVVAIAVLGPGLDRLVLVLALTSWPVIARVVRGEVMAIRELDYIRAATALGGSAPHIIRRQLLPNVMPTLAVTGGLLFAQVLLLQSMLDFLGLGDPAHISWGQMASQAQGFLREAWWLALFPGAAIMLTVLGVNLVADALSVRHLAVPMHQPLHQPLHQPSLQPTPTMHHARALLLVALLPLAPATLHAQAVLRPLPSGRATTEVTLVYPRPAAPTPAMAGMTPATAAPSPAPAATPAARPAAPEPKPLAIRIDYGQPHLRGRTLHTDSLVPYDKGWRTGASASTTLTTDVDLRLGGALVAKGTYVLYTIPSRTSWQLVVQRNTNQSPMKYDDKDDVARIPLRHVALASPMESLTFWLIPSLADGPAHGELRIAWGTDQLSTDWSIR